MYKLLFAAVRQPNPGMFNPCEPHTAADYLDGKLLFAAVRLPILEEVYLMRGTSRDGMLVK